MIVVTHTIAASPIEKYPKLFSDSPGLIKGIQVKLHVDLKTPPVTESHRRVPIHFRSEVEAELNRMREQGHIESVPTNEPTTWESSLRLVQEPDKRLRLCTYNRQANRAIRRERDPMMKVDDFVMH